MEEKYTQIKLNLGSVKEDSKSSFAVAEKAEIKKDSKLDDPETIPMDIAENRQGAPLDDDVSLFPPDEAIFTKVAENVNSSISFFSLI